MDFTKKIGLCKELRDSLARLERLLTEQNALEKELIYLRQRISTICTLLDQAEEVVR